MYEDDDAYYERMNESVDELMHYGVKGMKWGRRKERSTIGEIYNARSTNSAAKRNFAEKNANYQNLKKSGASGKTLDKARSEAEAANRARLDHRYRAHKIAVGEKAVLAILATPPLAGVIIGTNAKINSYDRLEKKYGNIDSKANVKAAKKYKPAND